MESEPRYNTVVRSETSSLSSSPKPSPIACTVPFSRRCIVVASGTPGSSDRVRPRRSCCLETKGTCVAAISTERTTTSPYVAVAAATIPPATGCETSCYVVRVASLRPSFLGASPAATGGSFSVSAAVGSVSCSRFRKSACRSSSI